jgi:hypothetical protein
VEVDGELAELVPSTTNRLTATEKKQDPVKASAAFRRVARTRFHVKTALRLHEEYRKLDSAQQKETWVNDQRMVWINLDAVCIF